MSGYPLDSFAIFKRSERISLIMADRESATLEQWLRDHPEVKIVSRDRGKDYARAVTRAAPQAIQVVDRFHLVRNLAEILQKVLAHCRAEIRQPEADMLLAQQEREHPARPLPAPT